MSIGSLCKRVVVTIHRDATVEDAAIMMRSSHIGDVVVVDAADTRRPVGIITDRDIAVEVVAQGLVPAQTPVGSVMSTPVLSLCEEDGFLEALDKMSAGGVPAGADPRSRRAPERAGIRGRFGAAPRARAGQDRSVDPARAGRRDAQDEEFLQRRVRELKARRCTRTFLSRVDGSEVFRCGAPGGVEVGQGAKSQSASDTRL